MPEIICPSGLIGEIRKLKVRETDILASPTKARSGVAMNNVLSNIWERTIEIPDIYSFKTKGDDEGILPKPQWDKVLIGDYFYIQLELSRITFDDLYPFQIPCPNYFCQAPINWEVELSKLDVKKLSDESKEIFKNGNRFEAVLSSTGKKIWFQLLLGEHQRRLTKIMRESKDNLASASLMLQVVEIEGIDKNKKNSFILDMDADEAAELREQMDNAGCGVETEIDIRCEECGSIRAVNLPFDGLFSRRRKPKVTNGDG